MKAWDWVLVKSWNGQDPGLEGKAARRRAVGAKARAAGRSKTTQLTHTKSPGAREKLFIDPRLMGLLTREPNEFPTYP